MAVGEAVCVRTGVKWNSSITVCSKLVAGLPVEAVHGHQAVDRGDTGKVVVVDVHPGVGEQSVAGDVVLVAVAVDHRVDRRRCAAA